MRLRIRFPEAVLAGVTADAQHPVLAQSAYQLDELLIVACEKVGIAQLRRLIAQTGEVLGNAPAGRLADRYRDGQRIRLRNRAGDGVQCSCAKRSEREESAPVHRNDSTTSGSGQAKSRSMGDTMYRPSARFTYTTADRYR